MHYAADNGHYAVADLLLNRNADINALDKVREANYLRGRIFF